MIRPDLILSWPRNCDYPLFRQYIRDHRELFNEIIIVFTETNQGEDYREFIKQSMHQDHILFVQSPDIKSGEDWRDVAIHSALLHSYNAEYIMFIEQDFFMTDRFWEEVEEMQKTNNYDVIGVMDSVRMHPCCMIFKRVALNKTCKNFGIVPDRLDHFGLIQLDIENLQNGLRFGRIEDNLYTHMNGLSHNLTLVYNGEMPNYRKEEFDQYLTKSLLVTVPLDDRYRGLAVKYLKQ